MMAAYAEMEEKYNTSHIKHRRGRKVATVNEVSENTLKNQAEKDGWKHTHTHTHWEESKTQTQHNKKKSTHFEYIVCFLLFYYLLDLIAKRSSSETGGNGLLKEILKESLS